MQPSRSSARQVCCWLPAPLPPCLLRPPQHTQFPATSPTHQVGRPFLLVIDSADRLCRREESERVLVALREYARDWAQVGCCSLPLVGRQGSDAAAAAGSDVPPC